MHRAFVYPWTLRDAGKRMPLGVVAMVVSFNAVNGFINGHWLFALSGDRAGWTADPRFVVGLALFVTGFAINRRSDAVLRRLRAPGETGYRVPQGGLFRWVSCPNYFGEIVEWLGWALATWSLPGLAFAVWTAANLTPRARANHRWYRSRFPEYPAKRKALVPRIW